jgi:hypothetical protein
MLLNGFDMWCLKTKMIFNGCRLNKNDSENKDSVSQGTDSVTQETILKFPQFFDGDEASHAE